jgi:hypothetical protein
MNLFEFNVRSANMMCGLLRRLQFPLVDSRSGVVATTGARRVHTDLSPAERDATGTRHRHVHHRAGPREGCTHTDQTTSQTRTKEGATIQHGQPLRMAKRSEGRSRRDGRRRFRHGSAQSRLVMAGMPLRRVNRVMSGSRTVDSSHFAPRSLLLSVSRSDRPTHSINSRRTMYSS